MEQAHFLSLSLEELSAMMVQASEQGATVALQKLRGFEEDRQLSTTEAMVFTGYSTAEYFRSWCKANGIIPVATRRRVNYYLLSALKGGRIKKNVKRK